MNKAKWTTLAVIGCPVVLVGLCVFLAARDKEREREEFVRQVRDHFRNSPEDLALIDQFGYPDSFLNEKIRGANLRRREEIEPLLIGFGPRVTTENEHGIVDTYWMIVGGRHQEEIDLIYDKHGNFVGVGRDGPSLGRRQ